MTDRASAEGLRHAIAREFTYTGPHDYREARAIVDAQFDAALRDTGSRPDSEGTADIEGAHHDDAADIFTGPRPDSDHIAACYSPGDPAACALHDCTCSCHSDPWPDLDGADTGSRSDSGIDEDVLRQMVERPMTSAYFEDFNAGRLDSEQVARALAGDYAVLSTPRTGPVAGRRAGGRDARGRARGGGLRWDQEDEHG